MAHILLNCHSETYLQIAMYMNVTITRSSWSFVSLPLIDRHSIVLGYPLDKRVAGPRDWLNVTTC